MRAVLATGEADVNTRGGHLQRTCLMVAVRRQDLTEQASRDLVTLLLEQPGIELNLTDRRGLTALHLNILMYLFHCFILFSGEA